MWTRTYTHDTTADPHRLWALLADVDGWVHWNDGIETIILAGPLEVGTSFRMTPPGDDTVTSTIVDLEPPVLLTDNTEFNGLSIRVEHRLDANAGGTTISYMITVSGDAPDEVLADVGAAVSADFPVVMANLSAAAS